MGGEGRVAEAGVGDSDWFSLRSGEEDPSETEVGEGGAFDVVWGAGKVDGEVEGNGDEWADQHSLCGTSEPDASTGGILPGTANLVKCPIQYGV